MDNGAYEKYKKENPDVYTPLSTYEQIDNYVHELTNAELVVCVVAIVLAVFALFKLFARRKKNKSKDESH